MSVLSRRTSDSGGTHIADRFFLGGAMGQIPLLGLADRRAGGQIGQRHKRQNKTLELSNPPESSFAKVRGGP